MADNNESDLSGLMQRVRDFFRARQALEDAADRSPVRKEMKERYTAKKRDGKTVTYAAPPGAVEELMRPKKKQLQVGKVIQPR